ncbi:MAG: FHA domain-containing protein [Acidobacteriota bacterium]
MSTTSERSRRRDRGCSSDAAARLIRKEKPPSPPKPPARPPAPGGIRAPGDAGSPGGMVCPGAGQPPRSAAGRGAQQAIDETVLETPAQRTFRKPALLGGKSIWLTVTEGEDSGRSFDITGIGTYTIGRKECDIVLSDDKVSRKHAAVIIAREGQYAVSDLASRNGTFVNGARLTRRNLQHNDLIRVGDTTLRFSVFDGPVPVER